MAYEAAYARTKPGQTELKSIPAALTLATKADRGYFDAQNGLFMRLFKFIRQNGVAMTVPVEAEIDPGVMRFYVPTDGRQRQLAAAEGVTVSPRPARTVASLGLRGSYSEARFRGALKRLEQWLATRTDIEPVASAYMVYWNSPFVPAFLKRSEVHVPVRVRTSDAGESKEQAMTYNRLTPEEEHIILRKGTERPFSGEYVSHDEKGTYACRRCDAPLFRSQSKFDSGCGWPSFDDCIEGAVKREVDAGSRRTEIVCANCDGHLGHVFEGEKLTAKDTRHCANSLSLKFVQDDGKQLQRAIFAGGCFWGMEYHFRRVPGVVSTTVGYVGGRTEKPTYREVCSHATGHAEAVEVTFDPARTTYEALTRLFFEIHDPTQVDRQGPDVGDQYRSEVFYVDEGQKQVARKLIDILRAKGFDVATTVTPAGTFWPAEDYHQDYYQKKGTTPYCHSYTKRF